MDSILTRESNTITIATFHENDLRGKYNYSPKYQRHSVWNEEKQSFFIDSILKNYPVPPIFLRQHIDDTTGLTSYDVVDGKQRLLSIRRFIRNEIPVSTELDIDDEGGLPLGGVYFRDLDRSEYSEFKKIFWRYALPIEYMDTDSEAVLDNIFDRLNRNGEPLTGQELRNAKYHDTELLCLVRSLANTTFWQERLAHTDMARMENEEFVSELLFALLAGGPLGADQSVIDALYAWYTSEARDWHAVRDAFEATTAFLAALDLDYDEFRIKGISHLYGLWCFAIYCRGVSVAPASVCGDLRDLFEELRSNDIRNADVDLYKKTMSSRTRSKIQRERRLDALRSYCGV